MIRLPDATSFNDEEEVPDKPASKARARVKSAISLSICWTIFSTLMVSVPPQDTVKHITAFDSVGEAGADKGRGPVNCGNGVSV